MVNATNSDQSLKSYKEYKFKSWANTDSWIFKGWHQVPRRSKHSLSTGHTCRQPHIDQMKKAAAINLRCCVFFTLLTGVVGVTCPFGSASYVDGATCYWLTTASLSSTLSNEECKKDGGILANILDNDAWDVLTLQMQAQGESVEWFAGIWIGLTDNEQEGVFKTMEGVTQGWFKWKTGEPSDVSHSFNCVKLLPKDPVEPFTYDDRDCSEDSIALCSLLPELVTSTEYSFSSVSPAGSLMPSYTMTTGNVTSWTVDGMSDLPNTDALLNSDSFVLENSIEISTVTENFSSQNGIQINTSKIVQNASTLNIPDSALTTLSSLEATGVLSADASVTMTTSTDSIATGKVTTSVTQITSTDSNAATVTDTRHDNNTCLCVCKSLDLTPEELEIRIQTLIDILTIPKQSTSASKRKLISAPDDRISARNLGYFGAAILVSVAGFIVFLDLTSVCRQINQLKNYHGKVGHRFPLQSHHQSRKKSVSSKRKHEFLY